MTRKPGDLPSYVLKANAAGGAAWRFHMNYDIRHFTRRRDAARKTRHSLARSGH